MSKVITFSRVFPSHHPKKGQPTHFIEKINKSLGLEYGIPFGDQTEKYFAEYGVAYSHQVFTECLPKHHTIRVGRRWKAGDIFSPRIWTGNPYQSKQLAIAPDITIKKTWDISIEKQYRKLSVTNDEGTWWQYDRGNTIQEIITNDGLLHEDFWNWFQKDFEGQIICWNEKIEY